MPIATSRWCSRSPSNPMPMPAASVRTINPHSGDRPNSTAPVAPAKPTCDSAWPAKVCARSTRKKPTSPETTATMPAAANAFCMKSYMNMVPAMVMLVRIAFDIIAARHHKDAPVYAHHVDRGTVEPRQHGAGDDLFDRADRGVAAAEIQYAIQCTQQRIDLVRAEQYRQAELLLQRACQFDPGGVGVGI